MLLTFLQVVLQLVEHAPQALLVLHPAVELGEHLVRIVDRRDRLVRAGVDMRVQVSARSGTMTPNSSEPNRVRVSALACR